MAGNVDIKLDLTFHGSAEISAKLAKLGRFAHEGKPSPAARALNAGAGVIRDMSVKFAPTRGGRKSVSYANRYARGRGWRVIRLSKSIKVRLKNRQTAQVYVGKPTGHLIEFGHATRLGRRSLKGHLVAGKKKRKYYPQGHIPRARAIPFLEPGIVLASQSALDKMSEVLSRELDKLAAQV